MKLHLICLFFVCAARPGSCDLNKIYTYEYGEDVGRITFSLSGSMYHVGTLELPVTVSECRILKYVRVEVTHPNEAPKVNFNPITKVITIRYDRIQDKPSDYLIAVKTILRPFCDSGPSKEQSIPNVLIS